MLRPAQYQFCNEFYFVEKSIEVVVTLKATGEPHRIRIDALYSPDSTIKYSTSSYIEEDVTVQPTYPQTDGKFDRKPERFRIWTAYDLPWTDRNSADDVLAQALGFLEERSQ
jgi:hypothetical protein